MHRKQAEGTVPGEAQRRGHGENARGERTHQEWAAHGAEEFKQPGVVLQRLQ